MTLLQRIAEFIPPLQRWYPITTPYGAPTASGPDAGEPHYGLDFGTPIGTPLYALGDGIVRPANSAPGGGTAGNTLVIDYGNGLIVLAGHLSQMFVKAGDRVRAGDWIATTGNSGITTGPHLHLEAWLNGQHINPLDLFDWTRDGADPDLYATTHGPAVPGGAPSIATVPKSNGTCPTGYVAGNDIERLVSDEFGSALGPIGAVVSSVANWLPGGFDPNLCYERQGAKQAFYDAATNTPGIGFADWGEAIVGLVTALLNPENWARVLAILLGAVMVGGGAYMIWQAT